MKLPRSVFSLRADGGFSPARDVLDLKPGAFDF